MRVLVQILLPLISIFVFGYSLFEGIKFMNLKTIMLLCLEFISLILINVSALKLLKVGSILWFIVFLISFVTVFLTIRKIITNS